MGMLIFHYLVYIAGVVLWLLAKSDHAVRVHTNGITSKQQYFQLNWVPILIRGMLEWALIFYPLEHNAEHVIAGWLGYELPFDIPDIWPTYLLAGFLADALFNLALKLPKIPAVLRENIPPLEDDQEKLPFDQNQPK